MSEKSKLVCNSALLGYYLNLLHSLRNVAEFTKPYSMGYGGVSWNPAETKICISVGAGEPDETGNVAGIASKLYFKELQEGSIHADADNGPAIADMASSCVFSAIIHAYDSIERGIEEIVSKMAYINGEEFEEDLKAEFKTLREARWNELDAAMKAREDKLTDEQKAEKEKWQKANELHSETIHADRDLRTLRRLLRKSPEDERLKTLVAEQEEKLKAAEEAEKAAEPVTETEPDTQLPE